MAIQREDLNAAAQQNLLRQDQVEPLFTFLLQRQGAHASPRFNGTNILYYFGGLLIIGAASLFATLAIEAMGMPALFFLTLAYGAAAYRLAEWLEKRGLNVPASMAATLVVALAPLGTYALQHMLGLWEAGGLASSYRNYHAYIDWRWLCMEFSTLAAGAVMLKRFRYPFLVMPVAVTLWYMSMDIGAWIAQADLASYSWDMRRNISLLFGLVMLPCAFFVDLRSRHTKDFAFWLYLFGLLTFWGALTAMDSHGLAGELVYLLINAVLILIGGLLRRRTFVTFGGMGTMFVLGDLSWNLFKDSLMFPFVVTIAGIALIYTGIWWSKSEERISRKLRAMLPQDVRELLEARAQS